MHRFGRSGVGRLALLLFGVAIASPAAAAGDDSQLWAGGSITANLSVKWRLSEEVTARFSDQRNGSTRSRAIACWAMLSARV